MLHRRNRLKGNLPLRDKLVTNLPNMVYLKQNNSIQTKNKPPKATQTFPMRLKKVRIGGFTLVELLVSIAIISMIVSTALSMIATAQRKGRDSKRMGDMNTIQKALEIYINDHLIYPDEDALSGEEFEKSKNGEYFIQPLTNGDYVDGEVPSDPTNKGQTYYAYAKFPKGAYGCDDSAFYVLGIRNMESTGNPHPQSPGWSCPDRDFQNDFEWVIGSYQY